MNRLHPNELIRLDFHQSLRRALAREERPPSRPVDPVPLSGLGSASRRGAARGPQDLLQFNDALVEHFSPVPSVEDREYALPLGKRAIGGLALAALGLAVRWMEQPGSGQPGAHER